MALRKLVPGLGLLWIGHQDLLEEAVGLYCRTLATAKPKIGFMDVVPWLLARLDLDGTCSRPSTMGVDTGNMAPSCCALGRCSLCRGGEEGSSAVCAAGSAELTSPGAPIVGCWAHSFSSGVGRGPQKFTNVSDVKAYDEERTWINRVTSEIVFQPLHRGTSAPVHEERVMAVLVEPNLHFELYLRDIIDGMRSPWKFPVLVVSKSFQEMFKVTRKLENTVRTVFLLEFPLICHEGR